MRSITKTRVPFYAIGQISRITGVNAETIRYYEKIGTLPKPQRSPGGRRVYGSAEVRTVTFIRRARELGFSPSEVRALLALGGPGKASCEDVKKVATHHLDDIRAKIADLRKLERLLATTISKCTGTRVPECPVIDILDVRQAA